PDNTHSGTAPAATGFMTLPASRSGRPEPVRFIERPTHGVKQLRPSHVSATGARFAVQSEPSGRPVSQGKDASAGRLGQQFTPATQIATLRAIVKKRVMRPTTATTAIATPSHKSKVARSRSFRRHHR